MMKRRTIALVLTVMMMLSLLTAYPAVVNVVSAAGDTTTLTFSPIDDGTGVVASHSITYPNQVLVGEEFQVEYKFYDYEFTNGPGSFSLELYMDTRYAILTSASPDAHQIVEATTAWTDASNYGDGSSGLAAIEATDKTAENIIKYTCGYAQADAEVDPGVADTLTVIISYKAVYAGELTIQSLYTEFNDVWFEQMCLFPETSFTIDIVNEIVEESSEEGGEIVPETKVDVFSPIDDGTGVVASHSISYPSQVKVGEEFQVEFKFYDYEFTNGPGSFSFELYMDTRYAILTSASPDAHQIVEATTTWTDASNYGDGSSGLAAIEATDKTTESIIKYTCGYAQADAEVDPGVADTLTVIISYKAVYAGELTIQSLYTEFNDVWFEQMCLFPETSFTIDIVDEYTADSSEEESSEESVVTEYTVTFVGMDGETIDTQTVVAGQAATAPEAPAVEGYTFVEWDTDYSNVTSDLTVTAVYELNTYTVNFYVNSEIVDTQTVGYGAAATAPSVDVPGYTLTGWDADFSNIKSDLDVNAILAIKTFTVTFVDGFGNTLSTQTVEYGAAANAPADPVIDGQTFLGWNKSFDNITEDTVVTATWEGLSYTVNFYVDGDIVDTQTVNYGAAATAPADPSKTGYTFAGWDADFSNIKADLDVNATWTINTYTVNFYVDGEIVDTQTVNYGAAATAPADPSKTGYTFAGWDADFSNVTGDLEVNAEWTINTYTVKFYVDGEVVDTQTVDYGSAAVAPADPSKTGYTFAGWDADFSNITGDLEVNAEWTINQYTVTFVVGNQGTSVGQLVWTVDYNTASSAITPPTVASNSVAYEFTGWDKSLPEYITEDITLTAKFSTTGSAVNVTFACGANGTIIGTDASGETVVGGYTVAVPSGGKAAEAIGDYMPIAIADENYTFIGWFNGDEEFDFNSTVEGDITLTAKFAINCISITGLEVGAAGVMGYANGKLYVTINDAEASLDGIYMVTFMHTGDGRTNIAFSDIVVKTDDAGNAYIVLPVATNNGYETLDVYLTDGMIDFSSSDWNVIDVETGLTL